MLNLSNSDSGLFLLPRTDLQIFTCRNLHGNMRNEDGNNITVVKNTFLLQDKPRFKFNFSDAPFVK